MEKEKGVLERRIVSGVMLTLLLVAMAMGVTATPWDGLPDDNTPAQAIWVDPKNTTGLNLGDEFVVDVLVNITSPTQPGGGTGMWGFQYKLFWNSRVLEAQEIQTHTDGVAGDLLPGWTSVYIAKNETGVWPDGRDYHSYAVTATGGVAFAGVDSLCTYKFKVMYQPEEPELDFYGLLDVQDEILVDDTAVPIDHTTVDGMYCVLASAPEHTLDVEVDVGSIHFRGEMADFYVLVSYRGEPFNASITAVLYYNGTLYANLSAYVRCFETGLYIVPYTIPTNAPAGTYALVVKASHLTFKGASLKAFLLSPTLTSWNALLISVNGTVGTIKTDVGLIGVKLDIINATLVSIEGRIATIDSTIGLIQTDISTINATLATINGTVVTINSTLGSIQQDITTINATIVDIQGDLVTINSTLGEIQFSLDDVSLKLVSIQGDIEEGTATIAGAITDAEGNVLAELGQVEVKLGVINATLTSIEGHLATIETDIGTISGTITFIQDDIATIETDIGTIKAMLEGWTGGTTGTITTPAGSFQILVLTTSTLEGPMEYSDNVLAITLSGPSGTTGTTNVVIPKQLLIGVESSIDKVAVTIDDEQVVFTYTEQPEAYVLHITYTHSAHLIKVHLTGLPPTPFPAWAIVLTVLVVAVATGVAFYILKIRKPQIASDTKSTGNISF